MKIFKEVILRVLVASLLVGSMLPLFETGKAAADGEAIKIDHTSTDITQIPQWAIEAAKANLHIGFGHTSHGTDVTRGMTDLVTFANGGGRGLVLPHDIFAWNNGGTDGALDLEDGNNGDTSLSSTWSSSAYPNWVQTTRDYLDNNPDVNVFMWSWCYEAGGEYRNGILQGELDSMNQLEGEYPGVTFVYMTGTLSYDHADYHYIPAYYADVLDANQMIRDYCFDNDKVLYDYGDIENWDPVWDHLEPYVPYPFATEICTYYDSAENMTAIGNWALDWQSTHTPGEDWYNVSPKHTKPLVNNLFAYTVWSLFARLAGWKGVDNPPGNHSPVTVDDSYSVVKGGTLNVVASGILNNDGDEDSDPLTAYKVSNPAHGTLTLNPDGSFTYIHDSSETTSDSFTYKVHDGYIDSNTTATVAISINSSADTQPPSVAVVSPNGGEKFKVDCQYDVTWTATDDVGVASCNISYSTDNGASYTDIATGQANDGSYTWTVPLPASATCLVKVAAVDAVGNWGQDESDAIFEICACIPGDADDSGVVNALDITKTERIILGIDSPTEDADANGDTFVNALDITEIEGIII
jgi:VCBS repeat-containing protein